jgi:hypothetical protein
MRGQRWGRLWEGREAGREQFGVAAVVVSGNAAGMRSNRTYLHEDIPSLIEIDCGEEDSICPLTVALLPAPANDGPFSVKISTYLASVFGMQGGEEDDNRVVSRGGGQVVVALLVNVNGGRGGLFGKVGIKRGGGWLLCR